MGFEFKDLIMPTLFVVIVGALVLVRGMKMRWYFAGILAGVKAAIPLLYFTYFYNREWMLIDDQTYFETGRRLLWDGNNPFLIYFTPDGVNRLISAAEGTHFLYYWWNLLALYLFGPFYSSPVFLNVFSTIISAVLLYKISKAAGFSERYSKGLGIFLLLHWDVLTWSSFVNLKDTVIMMMTIFAVFCLQRILQSKKYVYLAPLAATLFTFIWIRFYVSVLLLGTVGVWLGLSFKGWKRVIWVLMAFLCIWLIFPVDAIQTFREFYVPDWIFGPIRMALTPQPWSITPEYSFLLVPSILHWVLFIPAGLMGFRLAIKNPSFRLAAIYFCVMIAFYGIIPQQQTPRERLQVSWIIAWAQFDFLRAVGVAAIHRITLYKSRFVRLTPRRLVNQKV